MNTLIEKFLAIVLFVAFNAFANWTGSISEPENTRMIDGKSFYVINTADELAWFADQVNGGRTSINAVLEKDIVFGKDTSSRTNSRWIPIGKNDNLKFNGIIDGAEHTIYGLYSFVKNEKFDGLVGVLDVDGKIQNINLKKGSHWKASSIDSDVRMAAIAGHSHGLIQNCFSNDTIVIKESANDQNNKENLNIGAIVGINDGVIEYAENAGLMNVKSFDNKTYRSNYIDISMDGSSRKIYVGGVSGLNRGTILHAKNEGKIQIAASYVNEAPEGGFIYVGGITGRNNSEIKKSVNDGELDIVSERDHNYLGGISGLNSTNALIEHNINSSSLSLKPYKGNVSAGNNNGERFSSVGGLVGLNTGTVRNSFSLATQINFKNTIDVGAVIGRNEGAAENAFFNSDLLDKESFGSNPGSSTNVSGMTTINMKKDQFAWILNTTNGIATNCDVWSRTDSYPFFANSTNKAIYKITFSDQGAITNRYTNYNGLVVFPDNSEPAEGFIFTGWYNADDVRVKSSTVFSADQTIHSVYIEATDVFWTINFYNSDAQSTLLETKQYQNGSIVTYNGPTPTRTASAEYTYTFKGWDVEPTNALGDYDYHAVYDSTVRYYVIDFRGVGGIIASDSYPYGSIPACDKTPTRSSTAEWNYSFKGWSPEIVAVTKNATYKAVFDSSKVKYNVKFMKGDIVMKSENVEYGALPTLPYSSLPTDASKYTWDKEIVPVTSAETYSIKYYVDFIDYNGKILKEAVAYDYGSFAVTPSSPKRENTAKYTYTFKRWTPSTTSAVIEPVTYKAVYDSVINKYWIVCTIDGVFRSRNQYTYGSMPTCPVILPENTAQYVYSLGGMDKEIVPVIEDATYNVIINRAMQKYTITFRDFDGITLKESVQYDYGTLAADIEVPSNPQRADEIKYTYSGIANRYKYTFKGWKPRLADVTGNATYVAQYDSMIVTAETNNDNTILFKKGKTANGELLVESSSWKIQILGAKVGSAYAIFDMQGRVLKKGRVESANFNIPMTMAGNYLVRVGNQTQQITIK